jgi:lycopene cyclase domain-containing protein
MEQYQYLLLMAGCLLITLPLELVFGARVWRQPKRLAIALLPAFVLFVAWDLWASATGTWGFSERYTVGLRLPGDMAVEELVFFVVIPICGLLTLEAVRTILGRWDERRAARGGPAGGRAAEEVAP